MGEEKALTWQEAKKQLNKTYGPNSVALGKDLSFLEIPRIPTGIFNLDLALGGGIPVGRTSQFFGDPGSCKTTVCLRVIANAQKTCRFCFKQAHTDKKPGHEFTPMSCLWIELESTLDKGWAQHLGVDMNTLEIAHPGSAEEAVNAFLMFLQAEGTDVAIIDSLAHMTPGDELANPAENMQVGAMARALNKMFREETALFNKKKKSGQMPTVLIVNQVREKVGVMYGSPETRPGGKGQLFVNSLEIRTRPGKDMYQGATGLIQKPAHDGDVPVAQEFHFNVKKTKIGTHKVEDTYVQWKVNSATAKIGDIDEEDQIFEHAKRHKLFGKGEEGKGKWACLGLEEGTEEKLRDKVVDSGKLGELKAATITAVLDTMRLEKPAEQPEE